MAKSANQKLKLIYLLRFLEEKSDEAHPVRLQDMLEELARYDVRAEVRLQRSGGAAGGRV